MWRRFWNVLVSLFGVKWPALGVEWSFVGSSSEGAGGVSRVSCPFGSLLESLLDSFRSPGSLPGSLPGSFWSPLSTRYTCFELSSCPPGARMAYFSSRASEVPLLGVVSSGLVKKTTEPVFET